MGSGLSSAMRLPPYFDKNMAPLILVLLNQLITKCLARAETNRSAGAAAHHPRLGCGGYPTQPGLKSRSGWVIGSNGRENRAG